MKKVVIATGGSSGSIYAKLLLDKMITLSDQYSKVGYVLTDNAKLNWELELKNKKYKDYPFDYYQNKDFFAPFASGSADRKSVV